MSDKQKSFVEKSWAIGDTVVIGDRAGTITMFNAKNKKVQIEVWDQHTGEKSKVWHGMDELPPYPADDSPADDESTENGVLEGVPTPSPDDDGDTEELEPIRPEELADANEDDLHFEVGHKRVLSDGTTLEVLDPTVRDKWMCRVTLVSGGTRDMEKTGKQISTWGTEVVKADKPDVSIEAVAKAVNEAITEAVGSPAPPPVIDVPVRVRKRLVECFTVRDAGGHHTTEASAKLTEIVNDGWKLEHVEYTTLYVPRYEKGHTGYVETVVYWTFTRLIEPIPLEKSHSA